MFMLEDLRFTDLINPEDWQDIQDSLSEVLEITIRTFSTDGDLLTKISRSNRLLDEILPKVCKQCELCERCLLKSKVDSLKYINQELNLKCPFDLDVYAIPIKAVGERIIAYVVLGPIILKRRKNIFEYTKEAKKYGINLEQLSDALIELSVFSFNRINAVLKVVKDIFSRIAQTEYHKRRLGEIRPKVIELDPLFASYYEEKILNTLLNSFTLAFNADSGSVMTLDKNTNLLHIKVASKLDKEVITNTNVKIGEGIAGVAAATAEPIVLPKDKDKSGLSKRMKREYIKSSMIVPFNKGNTHDIYGVINLNITRKDVEFSERDILLARELVSMVGLALTPLRETDMQ